MNLTRVLNWCRRHLLVVTCIILVAFYFIGFRIYYCAYEDCTHPANWWFHLPAESQAAWLESLGTLVAVWWGFILFWQERREKREAQRRAAQPAAYLFISEIEPVHDRFKQLTLEHPEAPTLLAIKAKKGELKQALPGMDGTFLGMLQDDEAAELSQLNKELIQFNDAVSRCGSDLNYGGTTGDDLLFRAKSIHRLVGVILDTLRSRYAPRPPLLLEPSDSPPA
jgi:hypothetical protein